MRQPSAADTHPSLAEATLDPSTGGPGSGRWDVQPLIEEVEDFQIAYGVDGSDGSTPDGGVSPTVVDLTGANGDEWVGNVAREVETRLPIVTADANHSGVDAFIDTSIPSGPSPRAAAPALHSIWISLVVKSTDPDFVYDGPGARGIKILDSAAVSFSTATGRPYRRRPLSLAVSLRNNGLYDRQPTPHQPHKRGVRPMRCLRLRQPDRERGAALFLAILTLFILTIMGIALMFTTSIENSLAGTETKVSKIFYAADSGSRIRGCDAQQPARLRRRTDAGRYLQPLPEHHERPTCR